MQTFHNAGEANWPPTTEELSSTIKSPCSVYLFLNHLMKADGNYAELSSMVARFVESYANDIVHGVTRGKMLQKKQLLLGLGLHNLTGSRKIIDIVHELGHCISYNLICEMETAQAESAVICSKQTSVLPMKPKFPNDTILTHYWVDNFDVLVEKIGNGGSTNTTHLVAYQEIPKQLCSQFDNAPTVIQQRKGRRLSYEDVNILPMPVIKDLLLLELN